MTMIRLSPGILNASFRVVQICSKKQVTFQLLLDSFPRIDGTKTLDVVETCIACKWISRVNENLVVSENGLKFSSTFDVEQKRRMLKDFIFYNKPSWSALITKGRAESAPFFPSDIRVCFEDAALMLAPPTEEIIKWWDDISIFQLDIKQKNNLIVGREGEILSIDFETKRNNSSPIWKAIESNMLGYDILSRVSCDDHSPLLIEVKASTDSIDFAYAYISRNEWNTGITSKNYVFHFWIISKKPKIAIIDKSKLAKCIPSDGVSGNWEVAKVPFSEFSSDFIEI